MRLMLLVVGLLVVGALMYLDYRWKRWIAKQREERKRAGDEFRR